MFKKEFKSKTQTQVKSSERKKLRQQIEELWKNLPTEIVSLIVPTGKNDELTSCKLSLHNGDDVTVYSTNKTPWFFTIFDRTEKIDKIFPTIYLVWKFPDLIGLKIRTHREVFEKLLNGADLMIPGVVVPRENDELEIFLNSKRDEICAICLDENRYPIGIGQMASTGVEIAERGARGRAATIFHLYQDFLWNFGPKIEPPTEEKLDVTPKIETNFSASNEENFPSTDEILQTIFFYLCQRKAKNYQVPLLASTFFSFIQDSLPGLTIDLKQSSFKKFSKFLQFQHEQNFIKLEETKPGVLSIVEFYSQNEIIQNFRIPIWLKTFLNKISTENETTDDSTTNKYKFPTVTEFWKKNSRVEPFFIDEPNKTFFQSDEIRRAVRFYVQKNQLNEGKFIKPDEFISKNFKIDEPIDWNQLNKSVFTAMAPMVQLEFSHLEFPVRLSSALTPIEIECVEKNRKRQTFVRNLDIYQIDLQDLCKRIRQGASVSATIDENDEAKRHARIVMAQGNQIDFVTNLLKDSYGVPNKFIREIE